MHGPNPESEQPVTQDLSRFTQSARANPRRQFNSLMGLTYRTGGLRESFERLASNKAPGVDGVRKAGYTANLENSLLDLSARLRRGGYTPQPVRRVYIPKASGSGRRPLGIPAFEDRIVQDRMSQLLQAIWEPEFLDCSFGFRPGKSAHAALRRVDQIVMQGRTRWVVEADIKGFFNHVDHTWLIRFLEHRVADKRFVRTIQRFLKAGVMEDGAIIASEEGTPQGGLVSPVLSNIYLHYVLDTWFVRRYARSCAGNAQLVRYCDDFVAFFEHEADARRFLREMEDRLAKFKLATEPTKTQILQFGVRDGVPRRRLDGPRTFDFLGFILLVKKSRFGRPVLAMKTARARVQKKLREVGQKLRDMRTDGTAAMLKYAALHLRGHIQYYGVSGDMRSLNTYVWQVVWSLFKWLNRRSQKRSMTWEKFELSLKAYAFPRPRIVHRMYA